jgi:hypothetical protein
MHARKQPVGAAGEAAGEDVEAGQLGLEGFGGHARPSPSIAQCLNGGYPREPRGLERFTGGQLGFDCAWLCRAQGTPDWNMRPLHREF